MKEPLNIFNIVGPIVGGNYVQHAWWLDDPATNKRIGCCSSVLMGLSENGRHTHQIAVYGETND
jgi:hypothetical protein